MAGSEVIPLANTTGRRNFLKHGAADRRAKGLLALFGVLAVMSFAIQYRGANRQAAFDWNRTPVSIDQNP